MYRQTDKETDEQADKETDVQASSPSDPYMREWQALLHADLSQLQTRVCADDDHAATLRNASPLGFVLTPAERHTLRTEIMDKDL